ncbi:MAG: transcriptional regulator, GntR family with aminotransferase domain [Clostridia bacterium]|nr:transcriptional regulator, GntR family with aminotransferase domain [Clostridia bacterium]
MFHTIQLSKTNPTPLYIQLASEIARLIQSNTLPGGIKLPPIRLLSKELSINRDTVVSAYKLLENQGLVEAHVGKGTYVLQNIDASAASHSYNEINNVYCSTLGFSKELFPVSLCKELSDKIIQKEGWYAFSDPLNRERNLLNQNACNFLEDMGITATSVQMRIIKHFTEFLLSLFKYSPKQGICIEAFCDLTYSSYLRSIGAKIYEIPLTQEGLNLEILEKHLRSGNIGYIFLSSYLQNPTGICYSHHNKQKIIELAELYDCYIVEDGTLSNFLYDEAKLFPLFNHFSRDRVIYVYHFSKVYLPYLSYSFILLPNPMIKSMPDQIECAFNECLLRYYLESDTLQNNKERMIKSCKEKYLHLYLGLSSLSDKLQIYSAHGGLSFWLKPLYSSSEEICNLLIQHNIIVSPGTLFTYGNKAEYLRLSISHLNTAHIDEIVSILRKKL